MERVASTGPCKMRIFFLQNAPFGAIFIFPPGGNAVFAVFYLSAAAEAQKLSSFNFPPGRKRSFSHFSLFIRG